MKFWLRVFLVALIPGPLLLSSCSRTKDLPDGQRWWSHVTVLASDKLEGRKTGSAGYLAAANYVAGEFARLGLKPAGTNGYLQPVSLISREIDGNSSSLTLLRQTGPEPLTLGREAVISLQVDPAPMVEAELVFAGYGLSIPEAQHDDFAGLDVRGKLVVFLAGAPPSLPGNLAAHAQSPAERASLLKRHGAIGSLCILNSNNSATEWNRLARAQLQPSMMLADPSLDEGRGLKLYGTINPDHADTFLAGSGHSLWEIRDAAATGTALPRFAIPAKLKVEVSVKRAELVSPNVVAVLPGTDRRLKDESVVFSAHLDHLGIGTAVGGDSIYNGAMDNAAGVANLLEVAAILTASGVRLRRSVLFVAFTGEEDGLLGSRFFVNSTIFASQGIIADINTDMFLPLFPLKKLTIYGLDESDLGEDAFAVAKSMAVAPLADLAPERNTFVRSDQYSFIRRGVPALALKVGFDKGSPEEWVVNKWRTERYHAPSDDLTQPVDKEAARAFDVLVAKLLERIANRDERPRWKDSSFFKRFAR
jgi:Peptidase family M28